MNGRARGIDGTTRRQTRWRAAGRGPRSPRCPARRRVTAWRAASTAATRAAWSRWWPPSPAGRGSPRPNWPAPGCSTRTEPARSARCRAPRRATVWRAATTPTPRSGLRCTWPPGPAAGGRLRSRCRARVPPPARARPSWTRCPAPRRATAPRAVPTSPRTASSGPWWSARRAAPGRRPSCCPARAPLMAIRRRGPRCTRCPAPPQPAAARAARTSTGPGTSRPWWPRRPAASGAPPRNCRAAPR